MKLMKRIAVGLATLLLLTSCSILQKAASATSLGGNTGTPIYLSRIVRKLSGRTVVEHINELLLREAKMLLKTTGLNLVQIADRLHFADAPSFSRFFSRMAGVSPGQYRKVSA